MYRDDVRRSIAEFALSAIAADTFRVDASDRMPPGIFRTEMTRLFVEGNADNYQALAAEIAANIEAAWVALEQAGGG